MALRPHGILSGMSKDKGKELKRFTWRQGNRLELLLNGERFFPDILAAIAGARDSICIELYLFETGRVVNDFIQALWEATDRGVEVYLLLDDYGSLGLNEWDRLRLARLPFHLLYYNPLSSHSTLRNLYRILWHRVGYDLHRDHRKLILIDGQTAYVGGLGVTDEFYSPADPQSCWRENVVKVEGPVVADWHDLFRTAWERYANEPLLLPQPEPVALEEGGYARVAYSEGERRNGIKRQLRKRITGANHRIWLCTAYFLPSWRFLRSLRRASRNGIDVRLLLPGPHTDHPVVRHAGRRHYYRLLRSGVRIFEYQPRVLHAKALMCDYWVTIGSNNFDHWGLNWNLEADLEVDAPEFASAVQGMFDDDFAQSIEITLNDWHHLSWMQRVEVWFWGRVDRLVMAVTSRLRRRK
jgi:phosphatidylserine/phosphatidylglycerophosphate/cardiolipin synthase-like enzyme